MVLLPRWLPVTIALGALLLPSPVRAKPSEPVTLGAAPACTDVVVRGLLAGRDARASWTLVGAGGAADWHRRGDRVGAYRVLHVGAARVWLARPSSATTYAICQAELGARPSEEPPVRVTAAPSVDARGGAARGAALPLAHLAARIEERGPRDYLLDRSVVEGLVEGQGALAQLARGRPELEGGRTVGFLLSEVRAGSVLEKLGLKSGDRLRRAGGVDLVGVEAALTALARIQTASRFSLEVVRAGTPTTLDYEVR